MLQQEACAAVAPSVRASGASPPEQMLASKLDGERGHIAARLKYTFAGAATHWSPPAAADQELALGERANVCIRVCSVLASAIHRPCTGYPCTMRTDMTSNMQAATTGTLQSSYCGPMALRRFEHSQRCTCRIRQAALYEAAPAARGHAGICSSCSVSWVGSHSKQTRTSAGSPFCCIERSSARRASLGTCRQILFS